MESRRRSIAKALSWRVLAVMITAFVAYLFTDDGAFAVKIGVADSVIKLLVYYLHERAWIRASFGRAPTEAPEPQRVA
ncbi:MAG: DUF2061 domain-containing protein [Myxococcota bacterium]